MRNCKVPNNIHELWEEKVKPVGSTTCEIMIRVWSLYCRVGGVSSWCDGWIFLKLEYVMYQGRITLSPGS